MASKLVAFRDKDREFATALFDARLVDPTTVHQRVADTPDLAPGVEAKVLAWIDAYLTTTATSGSP